MSDISTHDTAIQAIDEQLAQLDADIQASTRRLEVDTAVRDRLLDLRATLSRKPRARRPRMVEAVPDEAQPAALVPEEAPTPPGWGGFNVVQAS